MGSISQTCTNTSFWGTLEYSESQPDVAYNQTTITATLKISSNQWGSFYGYTTAGTIVIDGENFNVSTDQNLGLGSTIIVGTASKTITHNQDGSKTINIGFSVGNGATGNASNSTNWVLTKIDRVAKTDSVIGSDIEGTFKVNYTKYVNNYTYKLRISIPNVIELEKINYNTSGEEFTLSQATITNIFTRTKNDTSNSIQLGFAVETWDGGTKLSSGNEVIIIGKIANANPIFDNFDFEDTNVTTVALTGSTTNNVINVNGYSNIKATITTTDKAEAIKEASMVKYRFSIDDYSTDISYSSDTNVSGTINGARNGFYNIYAIDSRNNSTLVTKQATSIIDYTNITFDKQNCSLVRDNNQVGENAILTLRGSLWNDDFGQVVNSIKSVTYKLKKSDSSTWITGTTTITPTTSGDIFTFTGLIASDNLDTTWDLDANYNVQVIISDELSSASVDFILNSAVPTMSLDKAGVGVMCAYDSSVGGSFQVDGIDVMNHFMTKANKTTDANGWTVIDNPTAPYIEYYRSGTAAINLPAGITWNNVVVSDLPVGVSFNDNIYMWGSVQCWDSALIPTLSINSNNKMIINAVWLFGSNGWSNNHKWYATIIKMR